VGRFDGRHAGGAPRSPFRSASARRVPAERRAQGQLTDLIEINVNNLAGVPSIVYGLLALGLFVYGLGSAERRHRRPDAGAAYSPHMIVATRESVRAVPFSIREAAYGVGATAKWQVTKHHVLPAASSGVATGVIIGLSRALGETAPLVTIGALSFIAFLPTPPVGANFRSSRSSGCWIPSP
jgi:phosphate transport system permease protein